MQCPRCNRQNDFSTEVQCGCQPPVSSLVPVFDTSVFLDRKVERSIGSLVKKRKDWIRVYAPDRILEHMVPCRDDSGMKRMVLSPSGPLVGFWFWETFPCLAERLDVGTYFISDVIGLSLPSDTKRSVIEGNRFCSILGSPLEVRDVKRVQER